MGATYGIEVEHRPIGRACGRLATRAACARFRAPHHLHHRLRVDGGSFNLLGNEHQLFSNNEEMNVEPHHLTEKAGTKSRAREQPSSPIVRGLDGGRSV